MILFGPSEFGQRFSEDDIFRGFDLNDIFKNFGFGGGGSPFSDLFGEQEERQPQGVNLYLSFDDIVNGMDKEFEVSRQKICDHCSGSGGEPGAKQTKCPNCNGSGRVQSRRNTPFGAFMSVTTCSRCGGRGRLFEKLCSVCNGHGRVVVTDRFKVKVERTGDAGADKKTSKGKFGFF